MNSYHSTTPETFDEQVASEKKAQTQDEKVLNIFKLFNKPLTAHQVYMRSTGMLLTSVRRSITNLYNSGVLEKGDMIMERYGKKNHQYFIKK